MSKEYGQQLIARSRVFSLDTIRLIGTLASNNISAGAIGRQLIRSATSIGANIVEGQASPTRKDFSLFMRHALKSANETGYWLSLLRDAKLADSRMCSKLESESIELARILGASLRTLRSQ